MGQSTYTVKAFNYAEDSDNRIHSDEVASQYGFSGGLVPGVADFAYMGRAVLAQWGLPWLSGGTLQGKLFKPIYHAELARVEAIGDDSKLDLSLFNPQGTLCAAGSAELHSSDPAPSIADYPAAEPLEPAARLSPSVEAFVSGTMLAPYEYRYDAKAAHAQAAHMFVDPMPMTDAQPVWHPAQCLHDANRLLRANVALGPWIHTGSRVHYLQSPRDGDALSLRGRVLDTYEKRGHIMTDVDCALFANGKRPLARIRHSAIIKLA